MQTDRLTLIDELIDENETLIGIYAGRMDRATDIGECEHYEGLRAWHVNRQASLFLERDEILDAGSVIF